MYPRYTKRFACYKNKYLYLTKCLNWCKNVRIVVFTDTPACGDECQGFPSQRVLI